MCYNDALKQPELTTAECLDILHQMADAGTLRLILSGGEILTRPDFFAIAEEARRLGFALDLKTNATLLTPASADHIAALLPLQVDISLLGAHSETFDAVAGVRGTLERVLRGVKLLCERGVRVKLNTLLLDLNINERQQMFDLAAHFGVQYEQVFKVSPSDSGNDRAGQHQLAMAQMAQALAADNTPFDAPSVMPESRTCAVGLSSCLISPYGTVYPCVELRVSAGNLREESFAKVWREGAIFSELRQRHTRANLPACQTCQLQAYCEGRCSGIAWKEHGDLYGGHSLACMQAQARYAHLHPGASIPDTPFLRAAQEHAGKLGDAAA